MFRYVDLENLPQLSTDRSVPKVRSCEVWKDAGLEMKCGEGGWE